MQIRSARADRLTPRARRALYRRINYLYKARVKFIRDDDSSKPTKCTKERSYTGDVCICRICVQVITCPNTEYLKFKNSRFPE